MAPWLQNLIVFATIAVCGLFALRQFIRSIRSQKGSCCSHGCSASLPPTTSDSQRIVFIPLESLSRARRRV